MLSRRRHLPRRIRTRQKRGETPLHRRIRGVARGTSRRQCRSSGAPTNRNRYTMMDSKRRDSQNQRRDAPRRRFVCAHRPSHQNRIDTRLVPENRLGRAGYLVASGNRVGSGETIGLLAAKIAGLIKRHSGCFIATTRQWFCCDTHRFTKVQRPGRLRKRGIVRCC